MNDNIILATDSYKLNHWKQYPKDTEGVYSYFESRVGAKYPYTVFFGLQYILKEYLCGEVVTRDDIKEAACLAEYHFGDKTLFNREGWEYIVQEHGGKLPIRIKAVPEGTRVPMGNVLMTVENTDPKCFWLTNALESILTHVWYSSTVATLSTHTIDMIGEYLDETGCDRAGLGFMLHDFGYRGATSHEAAAIGGAGHLISSRGTDTLPAMMLAVDYYEAQYRDLAFSVPATEHSVMTAKGEDGEMEIFEQLLEEHPSGILSVVSDSYDVIEFIANVSERYHDEIMARDGKVVFRPDSLRSASDTPEQQMVDLSEMLWEFYRGTHNDAGYKVLDPHVGLLWGDGIGPDGINKVLTATTQAGYAASNYVFGMGGGLLQKVNRDTQRFAFKCSAQKRSGEWHDVYKEPLDKSKASKRGRLRLEEDINGKLNTYNANEEDMLGALNDFVWRLDILETVFEDGELVREYTFDQVRKNSER